MQRDVEAMSRAGVAPASNFLRRVNEAIRSGTAQGWSQNQAVAALPRRALSNVHEILLKPLDKVYALLTAGAQVSFSGDANLPDHGTGSFGNLYPGFSMALDHPLEAAGPSFRFRPLASWFKREQYSRNITNDLQIVNRQS